MPTKTVLQIPVPWSCYKDSVPRETGKMTFDQALKALKSKEHEKALALMKEIDEQLGIESEYQSGVNDSPDGAAPVIIQKIKTPVSSEKLRYIAAVKGKALLEGC